MLHCAILGDSLAQCIAILRPDCLSDTRVGISSASYVSGYVVSTTAQTALLSLGVNDGPPTVETVRHLLKLRDGISFEEGLLDAAGPAGRNPRHDPGHRSDARRYGGTP